MPLVLDGRQPAREIQEQLARRVAALTSGGGAGVSAGAAAVASAGRPPCLAILLAGTDPPSVRNAQLKVSACRRLGMTTRLIELPAAATTAEAMAEIDQLNADPGVHGIFVQHPLGDHINERSCFNRISLDKDVGGDSSLGLGRMLLGEPAFPTTTPAAILRLLAWYGIAPAGRHAVVVGRSPMVGKPMAVLLLAADATVTVCHTRTRDLPEIVREADLLVAAAGRPHLVAGSWIRDGAVVVDAGFHVPAPAERGPAEQVGQAGPIGDIDLGHAAERCLAYTPVPGGVGPMTLALLLAHTVAAAERAAGLDEPLRR